MSYFEAGEKRLETYHKSIDYFAIGAVACGFDLSLPVQATWHEAFEWMGRVDDIVDTNEPNAQQVLSSYLRDVAENNQMGALNAAPVLGDEVINLGNKFRSEITDDQAKAFFGYGDRLISYSREALATRKISRYAKLAKHSGELSVAALLTLMPETDKQQTGYPKFEKLMYRLGTAGIYADWAIDMNEDYKHNFTQLKPSLFNKAILGVCSLREAVLGIVPLGKDGKEFAKLATRTAYKVIRTVLQTRQSA